MLQSPKPVLCSWRRAEETTIGSLASFLFPQTVTHGGHLSEPLSQGAFTIILFPCNREPVVFPLWVNQKHLYILPQRICNVVANVTQHEIFLIKPKIPKKWKEKGKGTGAGGCPIPFHKLTPKWKKKEKESSPNCEGCLYLWKDPKLSKGPWPTSLWCWSCQQRRTRGVIRELQTAIPCCTCGLRHDQPGVGPHCVLVVKLWILNGQPPKVKRSRRTNARWFLLLLGNGKICTGPLVTAALGTRARAPVCLGPHHPLAGPWS